MDCIAGRLQQFGYLKQSRRNIDREAQYRSVEQKA